MKGRIRCFLLLNLFFSHFLLAQDQSNFTQFYLNPYLFNASYVGIDGQSAASLIYRKQWIDIDDGPTVMNFSVQTPVNARVSTGLSVTNDKKGLLNNSSLLLSFGYNLQLKDHSFLRFGISGGGTWNTLDFERLQSIGDDQAITNLLDKSASLAANAGLSLHIKLFHFGIAMPNIISPAYVSEDAFTIKEVKPFQSLIFNTSYRFYLSENKNVFEPYLIYRLNSGLPSQFEVAGVLHLNHIVWIGGSFKQDFGISALGGIKLKNMFAIGASYSLKNSGINELNSPSFEISLNYLFGKHKKNAAVYSFVNTVKEKEKKHKVSASEAIAAKRKQDEEARKKLAAEEARKKQAEADAKKKADALAKKQEPVQPIVKNTTPEKKTVTEVPKETSVAAKDTVKVHRPRFQHDNADPLGPIIEEAHPEHEKEQLSRLDIHAENPTEHHDGTVEHPHAERHEFVKRGSHQEELDVSDYVIGGVFKSDANAKHFSEGLKKLGFKSDYGHLTEKNLWYVYLVQTTDINEARTERDRFRKMKIFKDAWLLTVHH